MQKYIDLDIQEYICNKDLGAFMSKDTLNRYATKIVSRMQKEVKLMCDVSVFHCSILMLMISIERRQ